MSCCLVRLTRLRLTRRSRRFFYNAILKPNSHSQNLGEMPAYRTNTSALVEIFDGGERMKANPEFTQSVVGDPTLEHPR